LELRSLLPLIDDPDWRSPVPPSGDAHPEYLVVVARSDPKLFEYLSRRFAGEPHTEVRLDRRGTGGTLAPPGGVDRRRVAHSGQNLEFALSSCGVAVVRRAPENGEHPRVAHSHPPEGPMEQTQDERQRVDRWLEESQYLIGRLIPAYLEDRDRIRGRLEGADQECDRLRQEVGELRRELGILQAEVQYYRGEHQAAAEVFASMISHLSEMQKPMQETYRRLQMTPQAAGAMVEAHSATA
jgi:hypothetical protein